MALRRSTFLSRIFSVLCAASLWGTTSAVAAPITECDFDLDGTFDTVEIIENRRALVTLSQTATQETVRFGQIFRKFSCRDRNADQAPEIIARKRNRRTKQLVSEVFYVVGEPENNLGAVCRNTRELMRCEIWKSIASHHITDQRASSTSFITTRGCPGGFPGCIVAYDRDGTRIHSLGEYQPTGSAYDNRHYGGHGCGDAKRASSVAAVARKNTGSDEIYLKDNNGVCVRVPDAGQCYNSSAC